MVAPRHDVAHVDDHPEEHEGPIPHEALALAAVLTRQGFQFEAREGASVNGPALLWIGIR